jgi:hypothetical protein
LELSKRSVLSQFHRLGWTLVELELEQIAAPDFFREPSPIVHRSISGKETVWFASFTGHPEIPPPPDPETGLSPENSYYDAIRQLQFPKTLLSRKRTNERAIFPRRHKLVNRNLALAIDPSVGMTFP